MEVMSLLARWLPGHPVLCKGLEARTKRPERDWQINFAHFIEVLGSE